MPGGTTKQIYNANTLVDKAKGRGKNSGKKNMTARELALASYVSEQGNVPDELAERYDENNAAERYFKARAQRISGDLDALMFGTGAGGYNETVGDMEVNTDLKDTQVERDDKSAYKAGFRYKLKHLFTARDIEGVVVYGARFDETRTREQDDRAKYKDVFTDDVMTPLPGVIVDAKSIRLEGVFSKDPADNGKTTIKRLAADKMPRLTVFTGATRAMADYDVTKLEIEKADRDAAPTLKIETEGTGGAVSPRALREKLSDSLTRVMTFSKITLDDSVAVNNGSPVLRFENASVGYEDTVDGSPLNGVVKPNVDARLIAGQGMVVMDGPTDTAELEKAAIDADAAALAHPVPAPAPAPAPAPSLKTMKVNTAKSPEQQKQEEEEAAAKKARTSYEEIPLDLLRDVPAMGKVKGLGGEVDLSETGRLKTNISFSGKGSYYDYVSRGVTRYDKDGNKSVLDMMAGEDYDNIFDFILGNPSAAAKESIRNRISFLKRKKVAAEELKAKKAAGLLAPDVEIDDIDEDEMGELVADVLSLSQGEMILESLSNSVLGENTTRFLMLFRNKYRLEQAGLYSSTLTDDFLDEFIGQRQLVFFDSAKALIGGKQTPLTSRLSEYWDSLKKGKELDNVEPIPGVPMPIDEDAVKKREKARKKSGAISMRQAILPYVVAEFEYKPYINFSPIGNLEIGPLDDAKTISEAREEFKEKAKGSGLTPEQIRNGDLDEEFDEAYSNIKYRIKPSFGVKAEAGAQISASLLAGGGMILAVKGTVFGEAHGSVSVNAMAEFILEYGPEGMKWSNIIAKGGLNGAIELGGSIGIKAGLASEIFDWEFNVFKFNALSLGLGPFGIGGEIDFGSTDGGSLSRFSGDVKGELSAMHLPNVIAGKSGSSGFTFKPEELPSGMQAMVDEAEKYVGEFDTLRDKVNTIMRIIKNPANAHFARAGEPSFISLKNVLTNLAAQLREKNEQFVLTVEGLKQIVSGLKNDKKYKAKTEKIADRIKKHQDRIARLTPAAGAAAPAFDPADALEYYKDGITRGFGKGDYEEYKKKEMKSAKVKELGLQDVTVGTETMKKYKAVLKAKLDALVGEKHALIEQIRAFDPANPAGETFTQFYKRIAPKSDIGKHLGVSDRLVRDVTDSAGNVVHETPIMRLRNFEKQRLAAETKNESDSVSKIKAYISENKIDKRIPNPEFSKWYFGTLGARTWLSWQTVDYLSPKLMLSFMQRELRTYGGVESTSGEYGFERLRNLERFKARHEAMLEKKKKAATDPERNEAQADADRIEAEARTGFFNNDEVKKNYEEKFYRTSTIDDLIAYEKSWNKSGDDTKEGVFAHGAGERLQRDSRAAVLSKIRTALGSVDDIGMANLSESQRQDLAALIQADATAKSAADKLVLEKVRKGADGTELQSEAGAIDLTSIGFWKNRKYGAVSRFFGRLKDIKNILSVGDTSHIGKRRKVIMDNVSFDTIIGYEEKRAAEYAAEPETQARHLALVRYLKARKTMILTEKDPKRQKALIKVEREQYFSGMLDKKLGFDSLRSKDHSELVKRIEDGVIVDYRVTEAILSLDQDSYQDQHAQRLKALEKLKKENPGMSALEAYYIYNNDIRDYSAVRRVIPVGTRGFEDWMSAEAKRRAGARSLWEVATIDQMIRFQKRKLARNTRSHTMRAGYLGTQVVDRGTGIIPILGEFDEFSADKEKIEKSADIYQEGLYGLYEKMKAWYDDYEKNEDDKSDAERQADFAAAMRENLLQGAFAKQWLFKNYLENLPPIAALEYEEMRAGEKGKKYQERLELIDKFEELPDGEISRADRQRYLATVRADHFFKRNLQSDKSYKTAYDKMLQEEYEAGRYELSKETAIEYQELRIQAIKADYLKMEAEMEAARASEAARAGSNADSIELAQYQAFIKNGGEDLMMEDSGVEAAVKTHLAGGVDRSAAAIIEFEESRIKYYEELQAKLDMPADKLSGIQKKYQADNIWIDMILPQIEGAAPEDIFNGDARFSAAIDDLIDMKNPGEDPAVKAAYAGVPTASSIASGGAGIAQITDGSGLIDTAVIDEAEWMRQIEELKKLIGE